MRWTWTGIATLATSDGRPPSAFDRRQRLTICSRRQMCLATLGVWPVVLSLGGRSQTEELDRHEASERLETMRSRARATRLFEVDGENRRRPASLRTEPLIRYNDPPRGIQDGTLWGWGAHGRPIATLKVERWTSRRPENRWGFSFVSLATAAVELEYSDGLVWNSRKPGWTPQPFPDAPPPADSATQRLVQMKELARRFSVTVHSVHNPNPLQLRLLPTPIDRYEHPASGVLDGALFALAFGTNPTVLLALEAGEDPRGGSSCAMPSPPG